MIVVEMRMLRCMEKWKKKKEEDMFQNEEFA